MTDNMSTEVANIERQTEIDVRCISCFLSTYQRLFEKFDVGIQKRQAFISSYQDTIIKYKHLSSPEIQRELNKAFCQIIEKSDPFAEEKASSNAVAIDLYNKWKPQVLSSSNPFDLALRLSIAGNVMDYGANSFFDIEDTINTVLHASFAIDNSVLLRDKILNAGRILYLGDNAGEVVFDKLFIETIMHHDVIYAVKDGPILNDVTMSDAHEVGMDLVADVISNGFDAPSTVLNKCSPAFLDVYNSADLIISKGQGNFEGLVRQNDARIFFLLMVKCNVIAEILSVKKGSFVVYT